MKKSILNYTFILLCATSIFGCNQNKKRQLPFAISTVMADSLRQIGPITQVVIIDPTRDTVVTGSKGTKLNILKNSFIDQNEKAITTPVTLELWESYSIADFITNNLQTLHKDGRILESRGMIWLNAKANGVDSINIAESRPIKISFPPQEYPTGTELFTGERDNDGHIVWNNVKDRVAISRPMPSARPQRSDTIGGSTDAIIGNIFINGKDTISFRSAKLGYVNVDFFYEDPRSAEVKLLVKTNESGLETYLIIKGRKVVLSGAQVDGSTKGIYHFTKREDGFNKLPTGEKAIIIAINYNKSKLRFDEKEITIGQHETEILTLNDINFKTLKAALSKYN
jgi:hypothetical protein